jgi:LuxR family maltose regulon positive regulatory protein
MSLPEVGMFPLIQTKLHRPPLPVDLVTRLRLTEWLDSRSMRPLTLVSAPAGYGKSTLAKCWLESLDCPKAWISLDERDDDLVVFLSYFLAALQLAFPGFKSDTRSLIEASPLPPLELITRNLVNELARFEEPFVLVLDDYHAIHDSSIHELLSHLLLHPPTSMHLVLCTRLDPPLPMVRLRAHGQLTEIRAEDLRFNQEEALILLQKMLGSGVDETIAFTLGEQTEGWVTGLRLAALAMRHRFGPERVLGELSASNRYVAQYLVNEILSQQVETYSACMLKISILERFNEQLCQALCFEEERETRFGKIKGTTFLDWLEASNLFVIPLDDQHHWFRFHHLFREFLQDELRARFPADAITDLHIRASNWFEEHDLIDEALQHAFAARNIGFAIHLVSRQRYSLMNQAQWQQIEKFLKKFPPEIVGQSLDLLILKAWLSYYHGNWEEIPKQLNAIDALIEQTPMPSEQVGYLQGEVSALRSLMFYLAVDPGNAILQAEKSIAATAPQIWIVRVLARICLAGGMQMAGDLSGAYQVIYEGFEAEPVKTDHARATLIHTACNLHWIAADLNGMARAAKQCIALCQKTNNRQILGFGLLHLGTAAYHQNDLESAQENFSAVVQKPFQNYGENLVYSYFGLALTYHSKGCPEKAQQIVDQALNFFLQNNNITLLKLTQAFQAELALRQGRISSASVWANQFTSPPPLAPPYRIYAPHLTLAKVWLAQNTPSSRLKAADLLDEFLSFLVSIHNTQFTIEVLALQALLAQANGERESALRLLGQALELAEPSGNMRVFIDHGDPIIDLLQELHARLVDQAYVARLLEAAQPETVIPSTLSQPTLIEPLTNRELEVLALLVERRTNKEIALQLGITPGTVRQHSHNLYQKLDVSNRREAVSRAFDLGVLSK